MNIRQLQYVAALADELHFLRAAAKMNVSQPTLSQQVKKLERELGTPLFERAPRRVRLTPAGEKFVVRARRALADIEAGAREASEKPGEISGRVRLSAIPTICPYLLPEVITSIKKDAPNLTLEIYEETTSTLLQSLKEGRTDMGILSLPVDEKGISVLSLASEKFYLAVSSKHRLALKARVRPRDLDAEKILVLQEGHCFGAQALQFCKTAVKNPQVIFKGSGLLSVLRLAAAGEGVTFVPGMALEASRDARLRFIPFSKPEPTRQIGVAWRVSSRLGPAEEFLIGRIRAAALRV